jgi:hypothetical protein
MACFVGVFHRVRSLICVSYVDTTGEESEHCSLRIIIALIAMIRRVPENSDDPSGNNRISNDSSAIDQFALQIPQNEGRIALNVF